MNCKNIPPIFGFKDDPVGLFKRSETIPLRMNIVSNDIDGIKKKRERERENIRSGTAIENDREGFTNTYLDARNTRNKETGEDI